MTIQHWEWLQIGIGTFLALVIFWQAWIYNEQRKMMKRQTEEIAARDRAYLGVKNLNMGTPVKTEPLSFSATVFNGGRTPAWQIQSATCLHFDEMPEHYPNWSRGAAKAPQEDFLPAGAERPIVVNDVLIVTDEWLQRFNRGEELIAHGESSYVDYWGEGQVYLWGAVYKEGEFQRLYEHHRAASSK